jgi:hypothetical protein
MLGGCLLLAVGQKQLQHDLPQIARDRLATPGDHFQISIHPRTSTANVLGRRRKSSGLQIISAPPRFRAIAPRTSDPLPKPVLSSTSDTHRAAALRLPCVDEELELFLGKHTLAYPEDAHTIAARVGIRGLRDRKYAAVGAALSTLLAVLIVVERAVLLISGLAWCLDKAAMPYADLFGGQFRLSPSVGWMWASARLPSASLTSR